MGSGGACPYYRYGQCVLAPVHLAYTVVNPERCRGGGWRTCRYYLGSSRTGGAGGGGVRRAGRTLEHYIERGGRETPSVKAGATVTLRDFTESERGSRRSLYEKLRRLLEALEDEATG